jgi:hypothetical protein
VTGSSEGFGTRSDYVTIAYDASSGETVWTDRYDGPANRQDDTASVVVSLDATKVFVTGESFGSETRHD